MNEQITDHRCPLCNGTDWRPRALYPGNESDRWPLFQCNGCGTAFIDPTPSGAELKAYYDEAYYGTGDSKFIAPGERLSVLFRFLRARKVHGLLPRGRVLDVGCGRGIMLKFLKAWGHDVDGIELDNVSMARAACNIGHRVFRGLHQIESDPVPKRYEAVCFWHSLEHLPNPGEALASVGRLLNPGGYLIIAAPNLAGIQAKLSGRDWLHLDLPRHLTHFDMERLARHLRRFGYRKIEHSHFSQEYNPIDTLCYFYGLLGYDPLYPYRLMANTGAPLDHGWPAALKLLLALVLLHPLGLLALLASNVFSVLGCGSTTTLVLQKEEPAR